MGAAIMAGTLAVACGSDDDDDMGTSGGAADSGTSLTLYQRLGEEPGLSKFVDDLVAAELMDAEIASYFFFQSSGAGGAPAAGHPSVKAIKGCLVAQVGEAVGGPQKYTGATADGHTCRNMQASHATLGIPGGVFDKFITIAAGLLQPAIVAKPAKAGEISQAEFDTIAGFLVGTKADVAQDKTRQSGSFIKPDAGN